MNPQIAIVLRGKEAEIIRNMNGGWHIKRRIWCIAFDTGD